MIPTVLAKRKFGGSARGDDSARSIRSRTNLTFGSKDARDNEKFTGQATREVQ